MAAMLVAASESSVMINEERLEGVLSIEYHFSQVRENIYALGSVERIGMTSGPQTVEGKMSVASTSNTLNSLTTDTPFTIVANLQHGGTKLTVTLFDCFLVSKSFNLGVGGFGAAVYTFTAARVTEEAA